MLAVFIAERSSPCMVLAPLGFFEIRWLFLALSDRSHVSVQFNIWTIFSPRSSQPKSPTTHEPSTKKQPGDCTDVAKPFTDNEKSSGLRTEAWGHPLLINLVSPKSTLHTQDHVTKKERHNQQSRSRLLEVPFMAAYTRVSILP